MTVAELIEALQALPNKDAVVVTQNQEQGDYYEFSGFDVIHLDRNLMFEAKETDPDARLAICV